MAPEERLRIGRQLTELGRRLLVEGFLATPSSSRDSYGPGGAAAASGNDARRPTWVIAERIASV
jgi:hypothetical protein